MTPLVASPDGGPVVVAKAEPGMGAGQVRIPRRLAAQITDVRFTASGGVEGRSVRTGAWADIRAHGAVIERRPEGVRGVRCAA